MVRKTADQARATRDQLVAAAVSLFAQRGFHHTTLHDVAALAGVTRGALYVHFEGKEPLYDAVCELIDWPLLEPLHGDAAPGEAQEPPLARLRRMVHLWLEHIDRTPLRRQVLDILLHKTEWTAENEHLLQRLHRSMDEAQRRIQALLEEAVARGDVRLPFSPDVAAGALQAAVVGLVSHWVRRSDCSTGVAAAGDWLLGALFAGR